MPWGGYARCKGILCSWIQPVLLWATDTLCFTNSLMCCLILTSSSFFIPPGCSSCTAGWQDSLWSAAQIHPLPPAKSLNSILMLHLLNTDGNNVYLAFRNDPLLLATVLNKCSTLLDTIWMNVIKNFSRGLFRVGWSLVINIGMLCFFVFFIFNLHFLTAKGSSVHLWKMHLIHSLSQLEECWVREPEA